MSVADASLCYSAPRFPFPHLRAVILGCAAEQRGAGVCAAVHRLRGGVGAADRDVVLLRSPRPRPRQGRAPWSTLSCVLLLYLRMEVVRDTAIAGKFHSDSLRAANSGAIVAEVRYDPTKRCMWRIGELSAPHCGSMRVKGCLLP